MSRGGREGRKEGGSTRRGNGRGISSYLFLIQNEMDETWRINFTSNGDRRLWSVRLVTTFVRECPRSSLLKPLQSWWLALESGWPAAPLTAPDDPAKMYFRTK